MKKFICLFLLVLLCGCKAGNFDQKRNHLHELGNDQAYCEKNPDRCVNGVPW